MFYTDGQITSVRLTFMVCVLFSCDVSVLVLNSYALHYHYYMTFYIHNNNVNLCFCWVYCK